MSQTKDLNFKVAIMCLIKKPSSPSSILMTHTYIHESVADEAVAIGCIVTKDLAQHWVVDATGRGILNKIHHEVWIPSQVRICRNHIVIYGLLYFFDKNYDSPKIGLLTSRTKFKIRLEFPLHWSLKMAILLLQKNQFQQVPC